MFDPIYFAGTLNICLILFIYRVINYLLQGYWISVWSYLFTELLIICCRDTEYLFDPIYLPSY